MAHVVQNKNYTTAPYRTGYEEAISGRCDDLFVTIAPEDGVVTKVTEKYLTIKYDQLGEKTYGLGIVHGTIPGKIIPHTLITDLKVNDKVKQKQAIVFNQGFFERSVTQPLNVSMKTGLVAKVGYVVNIRVLEDGCVLSKQLADKLKTPGCSLHAIIVDFSTIVHNLVTVGDEVTPDSILCTLEAFINDELAAKDAAAIKALSNIAKNTPKAKTYGKVSEIEVVYYGEITNAHESVQKLVAKYDNQRAKHVSTLGLDHAKTGKVTETIRVAGEKLLKDHVAFKIYIDYDIDMNSGDKLVFNNQLKATCSYVDVNPITTAETGEVVDALFGYQSAANRIAGSADRIGMMNSVLIALSKEMGKRFFQ